MIDDTWFGVIVVDNAIAVLLILTIVIVVDNAIATMIDDTWFGTHSHHCHSHCQWHCHFQSISLSSSWSIWRRFGVLIVDTAIGVVVLLLVIDIADFIVVVVSF